MEILSAHPFLVGDLQTRPEALGRYLPVIPHGMAGAYLAETDIQPGEIILDPFGASIGLVLEMAQAGYRVLTAVNNPINRFLMELAADPPSRAELQSALAELASSRTGDERLETHLQDLYTTTCPHCQQRSPAVAFIWERGGQFPVTRILECRYCGNSGEYDITGEDQQRITQLAAPAALHKARALERVAKIGDPDRPHVQETIEYYQPRAIYSLMTIINKLDGLSISPRQRQILSGLVLSACDEANTLWPYPPERPRPRLLVVPTRYRENNVWLALERSVELWVNEDPKIPVSIWPELPSENGSICIFEGRLEDLARQMGTTKVKLVLCAIPRPNQAFWSQSALWAGWLWGREAAAPFKHVIHRHRYDFSWHATALNTVFKYLFPCLPLNAPIFGLVSEPEPALLTATLLAAGASGFDLRAIALRSSHDPLQIHWQRRAFPRQEARPLETASLVEAVRGYLEKRAEPVTYLHLHAVCLASLADNHCLNWQRDFMLKINTTIQKALAEGGFKRFEGSEHSLEVGLWGLSDNPGGRLPLPDQVEMAMVKFLSHNPGANLNQIDTAIYREFQGLYTPQLAILKNIMASYAMPMGDGWQLREEDRPSARREDLRNIRSVLERLGTRLGYKISTDQSAQPPLRWTVEGKVAYSFCCIASAVVGNILMQAVNNDGKNCLVIPGGRSGLLSYKLERDPALKLLAESWQLLKYRQIRALADDMELTRQDWQKELNADPVTEPEQMRLF